MTTKDYLQSFFNVSYTWYKSLFNLLISNLEYFESVWNISGFIPALHALEYQYWTNLSIIGQLNSEWIYEVIVSPNIPTKHYRDFCSVILVGILGEMMTLYIATLGWIVHELKGVVHKLRIQ